MSFFENLSLRGKLFSLIGIFIAGFMTFIAVVFSAPEQNDVVIVKDIAADVLPPPKYIIESFAVLLQLSHETDAAAREGLIAQWQALKVVFEDRQAYWDKLLPEGRLKQALNRDSTLKAREFFEIGDRDFIPAARGGDAAKMHALIQGSLHEKHLEHRAYIDEVVTLSNALAQGYVEEEAASTLSRKRRLLGTGLGIAGVGLVFGWLISGNLTRRVRSTVEALEALAIGDFSRRLVDPSRDELGVMAEALNGATGNLNSVVGELRFVIQASEEGRLGVRGDAGRFQGVYAELVLGTNSLLGNLIAPIRFIAQNTAALTLASKELTAVSQQLGANADETSARMLIVASAAEEVSRTTESISTSTDEMAASIREIAKNATDSARVAAQAVAVADTTNTTVAKLGNSALAIGTVIKVITSIARQTNLLALNATIEAARAGEAGRGFAVVANEVKELAKATAKATEDIGLSIESIQTDTGEAVLAIATISGIIAQINDIATAIAGAVEEQSATTSEMGRNVSHAAKGSGDIATNIGSVTEVARNTSSGASQTMGAAIELARIAADLNQLISKFSFDESTRSYVPGARQMAPKVSGADGNSARTLVAKARARA
jgi:methyl-accepting chemotaxis protein